MQEINSMLKPVILNQHGLLLVFDNEAEMDKWMTKATDLEKVEILKFDCLNDLRTYIDRLKQTLSHIESMADDATRQ